MPSLAFIIPNLYRLLMDTGAYFASLVFPRPSNFCVAIIWLRHALFSRARALAWAQDTAVCPLKVTLELMEGLQGEKDKMWVKIRILIADCLPQKIKRDYAILQLQAFVMMCFIFIHFMGVIHTSSFCVQQNKKMVVLEENILLEMSGRRSWLAFSFVFFVCITINPSFYVFYFEWKKNESHPKYLKSCLQNYLPK